MNFSRNHNYYVYILTNKSKKVLYIGVTNDLDRRLFEHKEDSLSLKKSFAGKYNVIFLIYYKHYQYINNAIEREKELKEWRREKKEALINSFNPDWEFLNDQIYGIETPPNVGMTKITN